MAGTVVATEETDPESINKIVFAFTSHTTGAADGSTKRSYNGVLQRAVIIPGSGGTTPSDQFDVAVMDGDGIDVLCGYGANCSNSDTTIIMQERLGAIANDQLTLAVTNAGSGKTGTVILFVR